MASFQPNRLTFDQGIERIKRARAQVPEFQAGKIVTSRDPGAERLLQILSVDNIPGGFRKYQLPVYLEGGPGAQFFMSIGEPGTEVPTHSHDEGDGFRFIVSGSIRYEGKELTAGDWMFIPKGQPYSFSVEQRMPAIILYCYACCCA